MGGMIEILRNFQIDKIVMPNIGNVTITAKWYKRLMDCLSSKCEIEFVEKGKTYDLDEVEIRVISDGLYQGSNINNYSTVLKISYG